MRGRIILAAIIVFHMLQLNKSTQKYPGIDPGYNSMGGREKLLIEGLPRTKNAPTQLETSLL